MITTHTAAPLFILEAVRTVDYQPDDEIGDSELTSKKFGASRTVTDQIARYQKLRAAGKSVPMEELEGLLKLVSRRSDCELILKIAGQHAARSEFKQRHLQRNRVVSGLKGTLESRAKTRTIASVLKRLLNATVSSENGAYSVTTPVSGLDAEMQRAKCRFDGAVIGEILHVASGFAGALDHAQCRADGDDSCLWKPMREKEE